MKIRRNIPICLLSLFATNTQTAAFAMNKHALLLFLSMKLEYSSNLLCSRYGS
jgi:hypothetical protein